MEELLEKLQEIEVLINDIRDEGDSYELSEAHNKISEAVYLLSRN